MPRPNLHVHRCYACMMFYECEDPDCKIGDDVPCVGCYSDAAVMGLTVEQYKQYLKDTDDFMSDPDFGREDENSGEREVKFGL